jgi:CubicO group peptidase (beta-lactamase class C family)
MLNRKRVREPGSRYNYDNGLPTLAGLVIARATGEPLDKFAAERLFGPMGISNYRWTDLREGTRLAAGGLYLTSRDMAKLGVMMEQGGKWNGKQIVSEDWVRESTRNQSAAGDYPYGFYWHLTNATKRHVAGIDGFNALGQGGQFITVLPSANLVVVFTSSSWRADTLESLPGTPFGMINQYIVPALKSGTAGAN